MPSIYIGVKSCPSIGASYHVGLKAPIKADGASGTSQWYGASGTIH